MVVENRYYSENVYIDTGYAYGEMLTCLEIIEEKISGYYQVEKENKELQVSKWERKEGL